MGGKALRLPAPNGCRDSSTSVDACKDVTEPPKCRRRGLR